MLPPGSTSRKASRNEIDRGGVIDVMEDVGKQHIVERSTLITELPNGFRGKRQVFLTGESGLGVFDGLRVDVDAEIHQARHFGECASRHTHRASDFDNILVVSEILQRQPLLFARRAKNRLEQRPQFWKSFLGQKWRHYNLPAAAALRGRHSSIFIPLRGSAIFSMSS